MLKYTRHLGIRSLAASLSGPESLAVGNEKSSPQGNYPRRSGARRPVQKKVAGPEEDRRNTAGRSAATGPKKVAGPEEDRRNTAGRSTPPGPPLPPSAKKRWSAPKRADGAQRPVRDPTRPPPDKNHIFVRLHLSQSGHLCHHIQSKLFSGRRPWI